jgi:hypothetical protein
MCEDFICNDGGVLHDVHFLNGQGGHFGEEDAAEGIGDGGVDADEREGCIKGLVAVEGDCEIVAELVEGP